LDEWQEMFNSGIWSYEFTIPKEPQILVYAKVYNPATGDYIQRRQNGLPYTKSKFTIPRCIQSASTWHADIKSGISLIRTSHVTSKTIGQRTATPVAKTPLKAMPANAVPSYHSYSPTTDIIWLIEV